MDIRSEMSMIADPAYKSFQAKLIPTVDPDRVLGVRTPDLRRFARNFAHKHPGEARRFLENPRHELYEEMNLHAELIGLMAKTPEEAFGMLNAFLPHVDNWATCDLIRVPAFESDLPAVLEKIRAWCSQETNRNSSDPDAADPATEYVVRFGIVQLMSLFLDDAFEPAHLDIVVNIKRPEYYVNMARAWYFSYALIKQPQATLPLFEKRPITIDAWTHNKSLQKARESRRVSQEYKAYLQSLKTPRMPEKAIGAHKLDKAKPTSPRRAR